MTSHCGGLTYARPAGAMAVYCSRLASARPAGALTVYCSGLACARPAGAMATRPVSPAPNPPRAPGSAAPIGLAAVGGPLV
ncbi:hypothetical protein NKG94_37585 [Micromonospora sp. M12]